eukprot:COSAG04_NODE_4903_length_1832_cov_37.058280_3_plen_67_part_00
MRRNHAISQSLLFFSCLRKLFLCLTSRVQCAARGPDDGIDERSPIPGEFQVSGVAGSVFMQDTRLW